MTLIVTASHVSPDYDSLIDCTLFDENTEYRVRGDETNGYYASGPLLGCGKTCRTKQGAIVQLLTDNGYTGISITKQIKPTLKQVRETLAEKAPAITMRKNDCGEYRVTFTLDAIRSASPAMSRQELIEKAESLAAYESDIESAYETALAMNRTGLVPAPAAAPAKVETIELQMGWNDCLNMLLALYSDGNAKGRKYALGELRRMAALADSYVASKGGE